VCVCVCVCVGDYTEWLLVGQETRGVRSRSERGGPDSSPAVRKVEWRPLLRRPADGQVCLAARCQSLTLSSSLLFAAAAAAAAAAVLFIITLPPQRVTIIVISVTLSIVCASSLWPWAAQSSSCSVAECTYFQFCGRRHVSHNGPTAHRVCL